ncbi:phosphomevalonate kinase [Thelephora terrestris]|uniref:Phosphomevalonate kinase n=1 Tax=Thelephora terrestris TaxID=56493 RepID=A0A9P6HRP7_9AGAM|nr:phosphomevalonate kinase [Thelephora terrestris]
MSATVVSAPGKALLAGGYLILDSKYSGIVVSTSSRFYSVVFPASTPGIITVNSPQFVDAVWKYSVGPNGSVDADPLTINANKFVHLALKNTLTLAAELKGSGVTDALLEAGLQIYILGGNDFYSQRTTLDNSGLSPSFESLNKIPPFAPLNVQISQVNKTGLGSSAALITSLTAALLVHFGVITRESITGDGQEDSRRLAHNLAQFVHCLAQGKVGSGFDVSAAVFGSQVYTRFDPGVIQPLLDGQVERLSQTLAAANSAWTQKVLPFRLPPHTRLLLADVAVGSDTPSLAGNVLRWRQRNSKDANDLWSSIDEENKEFGRTLASLTVKWERNPGVYEEVANYLSSMQQIQWEANPELPSDQQSLIDCFVKLRTACENIRAKMREMGEASGAAIEPLPQTELLDDCLAVPGVIAGGVPGAGGYDAIWLLVFDPPKKHGHILTPVACVEILWGRREKKDVTPLSAEESTTKGIQAEQLDEVPGLREAISTARN